MRQSIFEVSEPVQNKLASTTTIDGERFRILDLGNRGMVLSV